MLIDPQADQDKLVVREIAGREFSLESGVRYVALGTPATAERMRKPSGYAVNVRVWTERLLGARLVCQITGLTYQERNELLGAFNNEAPSFNGRVWA